MKINHLILFLLILFLSNTPAQQDSLRDKILSITGSVKAKVGVAVIHLKNGDTLSVNGNAKLPMQSMYKFPLGIATFNRIDKGDLSLNQQVYINKKDLLSDTWSPLREKYPEGDVNLPLEEILKATVSLSDNNGCDILFRLMGGTKEVEKYIRSLGVKDIGIVGTEEEMHNDWQLQYKNYCTPLAMAQLFNLYFTTEILSKDSKELLWKYLTETPTGPNRIRGLLPEGTVVAHKTGTSGTDDKGISPATNDAGIIKLPDGTDIILVVLVSDSAEDMNTNELIIARIAQAVWEHYTN